MEDGQQKQLRLRRHRDRQGFGGGQKTNVPRATRPQQTPHTTHEHRTPQKQQQPLGFNSSSPVGHQNLFAPQRPFYNPRYIQRHREPQPAPSPYASIGQAFVPGYFSPGSASGYAPPNPMPTQSPLHHQGFIQHLHHQPHYYPRQQKLQQQQQQQWSNSGMHNPWGVRNG